MYIELEEEKLEFNYNTLINKFKDRKKRCEYNMSTSEEKIKTCNDKKELLALKELYNSEEEILYVVDNIIEYYDSYNPNEDYLCHLEWLWNKGNIRSYLEFKCLLAEDYKTSEEFKDEKRKYNIYAFLTATLALFSPYLFILMLFYEPYSLAASLVIALFLYAFISPVVFPISLIFACYAFSEVDKIPDEKVLEKFNVPDNHDNFIKTLKTAGVLTFAYTSYKSLSSNKGGWI